MNQKAGLVAMILQAHSQIDAISYKIRWWFSYNFRQPFAWWCMQGIHRTCRNSKSGTFWQTNRTPLLLPFGQDSRNPILQGSHGDYQVCAKLIAEFSIVVCKPDHYRAIACIFDEVRLLQS